LSTAVFVLASIKSFMGMALKEPARAAAGNDKESAVRIVIILRHKAHLQIFRYRCLRTTAETGIE
jgi:hypothetical protein